MVDYSILDMDEPPFKKRKDKFNPGEEKECDKSILWKELEEINRPKEYIEKLKELNTNPKYLTFHQLYFHAGDEYQYQKYGYLKSRLLSYPKKPTSIERFEIYNGYNLDTTYDTFKYLFDKVKKGIYVSIRDNKLDVFLPFSNIGYKNNWSDILKHLNHGLMKSLTNRNYNLSDPSHWYANNCFMKMDKEKYAPDEGKGQGKGKGKGGGNGGGGKGKVNKNKQGNIKGKGKGVGKGKGKGKEYLQEGDKTETIFKYFLIYFLQDMKKQGKKINDLDFLFSPRDFPVFRKGGKEPYDKLLGDQKLESKYIHDKYTPILSQCTNIDFNDIPIPTQDDMVRITNDIYPDDCKNNYSKELNLEKDWSKKMNKCVFRGSATGCGITVDTNMRLKSAYLSELYNKEGKDILDAKLTSWNAKPKADEKLGTFNRIKLNDGKFTHKGISISAGEHNFMNLEEQSKHKYILNIDGHVKAFRLGNELRMGSVVLLVDSPYKLWFQDLGFKDMKHYILIKNDLSDLDEKIEWCIQNDDKCIQIAKNSLDFYNKYLSKEGMYDYFFNLLNDLSKIRKRPKEPVKNNNKLNIVVAYRDPGDGSRKMQLEIFKEQMDLIFEGRTNYHIYIVEQEGDRKDYEKLEDGFKQPGSHMAKFNLGRLKNIGFIEANKDNEDIENSYYVLTDVDLLPSNELLEDFLKYPKSPIHLGNMGTRYNMDGKKGNFLGGVISFNAEDFNKTNGYPNNFWGWGGEDESLIYRLKESNIEVERSEYPVIDLEEATIDEKMIDLKANKTKEMLKIEKLAEDKQNDYWKNNGLNDIESLYKIINKEQSGRAKNITHIKVHLKIGDEESSSSSSSEEEIKGISDKNTKDKNDLSLMITTDLYKEYNECEININDNKGIKENKERKRIIKQILDDRDLDDSQLKELSKRSYNAYPDYNNASFIDNISRKAEFNLNKISLNKDGQCDNDEFELANHQRLLKNFVNNNTPYKSLLLFHGVGVGKTCSGVTISESFRDTYVNDNKKIIIVRKGGLSQGWKDTIFDPEKGDNQCSGNTFLDIMKGEKGYDNKKDSKSLKTSVNKAIKKYYEFYQYGTFNGLIKKIIGETKDDTAEGRKTIKFKIDKYFSNRLLIIDEYHNLREEDENISDQEKKTSKKEQNKALKNIYNTIKYSNNLRIIFLTATPMFNKAREIFLLINLMLLNDNRPLMDEKEYIDKNGNITPEGKEMINKKSRGYISYLRGENPINFPLRLYPDINNDKLTISPKNAPKKDIFGKDIENPLRFLITYKDTLKGYQKKIYKGYKSELDEDKKIGINKLLPQICNIVYPSERNFDYGERGFKEVFNKSGHGFEYKNKDDPILSNGEINKYSAKITNILSKIKSSEGIIFIYSDYIWSGSLPIGLALEHVGFNKYGDKNLLNHEDVEEPLSYDMKKKISDYSDKSSFKQANYIILSGNDSISGDNDNELKILKSEENKNGELIKVVIGSSITGEGIDFKNIREIHVMDPWYHLNKLEQIIGRGIRFCSHTMLNEGKRNVTVYLHAAVYKKGKIEYETLDHYNYRRGETKSIEIGEIEMILKKNAVDCYLFKDGNLIKEKDVLPTNLVTSQNTKIKKYEIFDKPHTKICSFQDNCNYECENLDKDDKKILDGLNEDSLDYDTFDINNFKDITKKIANYINELFERKNYYSLNDIVEHIQYHQNMNKYIIYSSIKDIIDNKEVIYDKNKNKGYIICRNDLYIFQPLLNNDESIPIYYRSTLVNNTNKINIDDLLKDKFIEWGNATDKSTSSSTQNETILEINTNIQNIIDEKIKDYKKLISSEYLVDVGISKNDKNPNEIKVVLCEYLIDQLSYKDKKKYMEYLINNKNDYMKTVLKESDITKPELLKISYEYFKYNFIYKSDKNYCIFEKLDADPVGYFILNESIKTTQSKIKNIEYYRIESGESVKINPDKIIKQFKNFKDTPAYNTIFKTNTVWIYSYKKQNKEKTEIKPYFKIVDKETYPTAKGAELSEQIPKLMKSFKLLQIEDLENRFDLKLNRMGSMIGKNKYKLIEIIFRLKDKLSEDIRYFINYDIYNFHNMFLK